MSSTSKASFTSRYTVTKHSWKGKYTRIFCISRKGVATINPSTIFKITNEWDFGLMVSCDPNPKVCTEFQLVVRKAANSTATDSLVFSCESQAQRNALITDVQRLRHRFDNGILPILQKQQFQCQKYRFNEEWKALVLHVTNVAVLQKNDEGKIVGEYMHAHIEAMGLVKDDKMCLVIKYGRVGKLHMYKSEMAENILRTIQVMGTKYVGIKPIPVLELTKKDFEIQRLGVRNGPNLVPTGEFKVAKLSAKHVFAPMPRILGTADRFIIERDPSTYNIIAIYELSDVFALIRCEDDAQKFMIEYKKPAVIKTYTSSARDAVLAHILDACRCIGHNNAAIRVERTDRGKRAAPSWVFVSEEIESTLLRCLADPEKVGGSVNMPFNEVVEYFNANIEYSGLRSTENRNEIFAENREKLIYEALHALLNNFPKTEDPFILVQQFYALRRLCVCRTGFASVAVVPGFIKAIGAACISALKLNSIAVSHSVIDFLNVLMTPMHNHFERYHEQVNKQRLLQSESFLKFLLSLLKVHIEQDSGAIVILSLLDFFVYAICPPFSDTTLATSFEKVVKEFINVLTKPIFALLHHSCRAIRYSTGMLILVVLEEGTEEEFLAIQHASLTEGGFVKVFSDAAYDEKDRDMRDLTRKLIALFAYDHQTAQDLLRRMMPLSLLQNLQSKDEVPEEEKMRERERDQKAVTNEFKLSKQKFFVRKFNPMPPQPGQNGSDENLPQVKIRERVVQVQPVLNWEMLFYQMKLDHLRPDLIWTHNTRSELRDALDAEIDAFQRGMQLRKDNPICWNFQEFEVLYPSLENELRIGHHYPRILFESENPVIARPKEFFNDMYHRFLLVQDFDFKCQCLHGMAILYKHYAEEIGAFNDIEYMLKMLDACDEPLFRDRMLLFLQNLILARLNIKTFIDCNGMKPLIELVTLAHLHVDRPQIHTNTMAIEASRGADLQDQEAEWYYVKGGEKQPPVSYSKVKKMFKEGELTPTTKMWAQGLGAWRKMKDIPQLKWGVINDGKAGTMTLTELSCTVLDMFIHLCAFYPTKDSDGSIVQPIPRVKRFLCDPAVLPHIVQLLVTFDPTICTRVHNLLKTLMDDNPMMPRLFLTGYFFFSMMYSGSDVMPLVRMLHLSHNKQSFMTDSDNEILKNSILTPMLPPALVCVLHNHGPQKFAETFLGEWETPEAIWGKDMRRYLIEKIAAHICEFTPRVVGNVRAQYAYCPIVGVEYDTIKDEVFCSMYYLRHLCDETKYPTWPLREPVLLLRDILATWKRELEKKPSRLDRDGCLEILEIKEEEPTPSQIRKAYFKLAAIYHPDKNPNGREMFEKVQVAYEFLASNAKPSDEPDDNRVYLLLRTQSILFSRCSDVLNKYKYAGYPLLLALIQQEFANPKMLNKPVVLIEPAVELCYHSVNNCAMNADELQMDGGIELISQVLDKCFELVTPTVDDNSLPGKVVTHALKTFAVAAQFKECLQKVLDIRFIPIHSARAIAFRSSPKLSRAGVAATRAYCAHASLQELVVNAGAVWHLLLYIFKYDATVVESGIELSEENHKQLFDNRAAQEAFSCLKAMAGFKPHEEDIDSALNAPLLAPLEFLLTRYLVEKMQFEKESEHSVLKLLNDNSETPYFVWNNACREELRDFVKRYSDMARDGAATEGAEMPPLTLDDQFEYSAHSQELIVGGIFVRVYNMQPQFPIKNAAAVMQELITGAAAKAEANQSEELEMILQAMKHLFIAKPNVVGTACVNKMEVLLNMAAMKNIPSTSAALTLEFLAKCCDEFKCIEVLPKIKTAFANLAFALSRGSDTYEGGLMLFTRVLQHRDCVHCVLDRGIYVLFLHIFCKSRNAEVRELACQCVSKACADKIHGPKIVLRARKLMPQIFLDVMRETPAQVAQMFEMWQENPELVWNAQARDRVCEAIAKASSDVIDQLTADPLYDWNVSAEMSLQETVDTFQVGGVYLSLFKDQPNWKVRKPRQFLQELFEKFIELAARPGYDKEIFELVSASIVHFLRGQPSVADYLVAIGCIPKFITALQNPDPTISCAAAEVFHEISASKACVESMAACDPMTPLKSALDSPRMLDARRVLLDTVDRLVARSSEFANMLKFALDCLLPQKLLEMLEENGSELGSSGRALITKCLKTMLATEDPLLKQKINHILSRSDVWRRYKDQSHELFLPQNGVAGLLAGPKNMGPTLAITAAPVGTLDDEPPPMSDDE